MSTYLAIYDELLRKVHTGKLRIIRPARIDPTALADQINQLEERCTILRKRVNPAKRGWRVASTGNTR
jgi:hypothetical protein